MFFRVFFEVLLSAFAVFGFYSMLFYVITPYFHKSCYEICSPFVLLFFNKDDMIYDEDELFSVIINTVDDTEKAMFLENTIFIIFENFDEAEIRSVMSRVDNDKAVAVTNISELKEKIKKING